MSNVKTAAALVGGYVLGRTKKAKLAISVGLWLSGHKARPADIVRDQVVRFLKSPDGEKLLAQVRGPAVDAGVRAATAVYEAQARRLAENLHQRTARISETLGVPLAETTSAGQAAGQAATRTVGDTVTGVVEGLVGGRKPAAGTESREGAERPAGGAGSAGERPEDASARAAAGEGESGEQEGGEQDTDGQRRPRGRSAPGRQPAARA